MQGTFVSMSRRSAVTLRTFIVKTKLGANTRAGASWWSVIIRRSLPFAAVNFCTKWQLLSAYPRIYLLFFSVLISVLLILYILVILYIIIKLRDRRWCNWEMSSILWNYDLVINTCDIHCDKNIYNFFYR